MPEDVEVPVRGALRKAWLCRPAGPHRGTVVFVHGSGDATRDDFAWYTGQLTDLGIACLVVDKVMDGYTRTRRRYRLLADDACDALVWVHAHPHLAGSPVALLGYSEGSWVATMAAAKQPELVDLVVLCSAPLVRPRNQTSYHWANLDPSRPRLIRMLRRAWMWIVMAGFTDYGNQDITADLRVLAAPVLLILGAEDPTLDVALACRVFDQTRHGVPAPILVPDADHALPPDRDWLSEVAGAFSALSR